MTDIQDQNAQAPAGAARGASGRARRALRGRLLAVAFGLVLAFVAAEALLRVLGVEHPNFYRPDDVLGMALLEGAEGWYTGEGAAYVRINSDGLRDGEHALAKPPQTVRIAVLGDSYAEAKQVDVDDTFWAVLERELPERCELGGRRVEVINFGCAGYGTAQEYLTLRHRVWDYDPDVVLLAFYLGNDVADNVRALKKVDHVPYFVLRDGALVLDDSFLESAAYRKRTGLAARVAIRVLPYLRTAQLLKHVWYLRGLDERRGDAEDSPFDQPGQSERVYSEPRDENWRRAWRVTEALLRRMYGDCQARGVAFVVAMVSTSAQVHPDESVRRAYRNACGVEDLFYGNRRVEGLGERLGFSVLTLAHQMRGYAEAHDVFLHGFGDDGFGHWNEVGHGVAGTLIADGLARVWCDGGFQAVNVGSGDVGN